MKEKEGKKEEAEDGKPFSFLRQIQMTARKLTEWSSITVRGTVYAAYARRGEYGISAELAAVRSRLASVLPGGIFFFFFFLATSG